MRCIKVEYLSHQRICQVHRSTNKTAMTKTRVPGPQASLRHGEREPLPWTMRGPGESRTPVWPFGFHGTRSPRDERPVLSMALLESLFFPCLWPLPLNNPFRLSD
ncbi:hypothetical protein H112_07664 [Trichophyton rubrum D6]|uniref:Uncharacterized protein n=2 Tax=Trichophyton TaxID=5550 RepID=A0A022VSQ0_TRIRU|nr:hypothetical protein H100_07689 [Trichophyton rubrum MR850]EZF38114.1 hypothetical protein H102_07654 [Trichophyton rubrum CBS 100081]EZF48753.1 hypothetical protein H103_07677 [Trichophyton rubrum CBS 288.86]EZF59451.1 hypothetical protein H104_07625 [Trichophyton rubrum CBS 289.86]EZF69991.1 hypothetical protein H105_07680 [Trichophyton soudanense CBS 452.61]EZF80685.1 hypothetical protein H110_07674 [Trichophyton rubrum MR1448]EZF91333.1 hypothetical protein H113_07735 [Trichophyton rub